MRNSEAKLGANPFSPPPPPLRTLWQLAPEGSVVDPHHFDEDPDSTFHPDADPDPDPSFQIKT